jgi:hypothetical protein
MPTISSSSQRKIVQPSGLSELLWSCLLDDYLSEEEDNEFSKIVGRPTKPQQESPWCFAGPQTQVIQEDPRSMRIRGGTNDSVVGRTDGTPGVWSKNPTPEFPPVLWLNLPPEDSRDDGSELSQQTPPQKTKTLFQKKRSTQEKGHPPQPPRQSRSTKEARNLGPQSLSRGRSRTGSRAGSMAGSHTLSREGSLIGSRTGSRATSESTRSKSLGRKKLSRSRGTSRNKEAEERRQPSDAWREQLPPRQVQKKSNRSVSSRQKLLESLMEGVEPSRSNSETRDRTLRSPSNKRSERENHNRHRAINRKS